MRPYQPKLYQRGAGKRGGPAGGARQRDNGRRPPAAGHCGVCRLAGIKMVVSGTAEGVW
jgi:hypothetical protein